MYNGISFTNTNDIESIIEHAFAILEEYGVLVESDKAVKIICDLAPGLIVFDNGRIKLKKYFVSEYFNSFKNTLKENQSPSLSVTAEIYEGFYLDPYDGEFKPWNEDLLLNYYKVGKALAEIDNISMLGCPLPDLPQQKRPLYEKLYAFKYGITGSYSIWETELCPKLLEIWKIYSCEIQQPIEEVFQGTVFMISPLRMGHVELEQMLWFRERGLKVGVGTLASLGISAPITLAGAIAIHLAEQLFLSVLHLAFYNERKFSINASLSVVDMRTSSFQYGRPEQVIMNNAMSDIAMYYGLPFSAHCGLSDAKKPSYEAGLQKTGTALAAIMKGRKGHIAAGLLSVDEIFSPVQMVLDNECSGYLRHICKGFEINEDTLAMEVLGECLSENSMFIDKEHTVKNFRETIWTTSIFSNEMKGQWDKKIDKERARQKAMEIIETEDLYPQISEECENKILMVINSI
jgi:trimethylamine--corrinoid protein Co-methyltransferase